ncbi:calcium-binding protein [Sphingosinicella sp. BN140058]|uniref:calcium-binding protein n=1 Tax=Sphingosinicella sp. BN140058 TaxID=1892855 RepID=UPI0013EA9CCB|nr:calcium-binding protein [Sphingosinicella sp. BN140058]
MSAAHQLRRTSNLFATKEADALALGALATPINGASTDDILKGTAGDDIIEALGGQDRADGGGGNDLIRGGVGNDRLYGDAGEDRLEGGDGIDQLHGGADNDVLIGGAGNDTLYGGDGNDRLEGGSGASNWLEGGLGDDVILGGDQVDIVWIREAGSDTVSTGAGKDQVNYSADVAGDHQVIDTGNDDDRVQIDSRGATTFQIATGAGNDLVRITGLAAQAEIGLGTGTDVVEIKAGGLAAGAVITFTDFQAGADGDRIDWIDFLGGALVGWDRSANPFGAGFLRLRQVGSDSVVEIDRDGTGGPGAYDTLLVFKNTNGADFRSTNLGGFRADGAEQPAYAKTGTDAAETLAGTIGHDVIDGAGGDDTINGGAGSDMLRGGAGADKIDGDIGDDLVEGGDGNDSLRGGRGTDFVQGQAGHDFLYADSGADVLDGGAGSDWIQIQASDALTKTAWGGAGEDRITIDGANGGDFIIDGGSENDWISLSGLRGTAYVTLGADIDVLRLDPSAADLLLTEGHIIVRDFDTGFYGDSSTGIDGDRLEFVDFLAAAAPTWDGSNPFASGFARLVWSGDDTLLQIDANGGGDSFRTIVTFQDQYPFFFTSFNLDGFSQGGTVPPGLVLVGTDADDTLHGGRGNDVIQGLEGFNKLYGDYGDDEIRGGSFYDEIHGEAGADRLYGGAGWDWLYGGAGDDYLDGGEGNDTIRDDSGSDTIFGGAGFDSIEVNRSGDQSDTIVIDAGSGYDYIQLNVDSTGDVTVYADGGAGDDAFRVDAMTGNAVLTLGEGNDKIYIGGYVPYGDRPPVTITVKDFQPGDSFDLSGYNPVFNDLRYGDLWAFLFGPARIVQAGQDTRIEFLRGREGDAYVWDTILILEKADANRFVRGYYFDTSPIYGSDLDETIVGEWTNTLNMSQGGNDTVSLSNNDNRFYFGGAYTGEDTIRGGSEYGNDTLILQGVYGSGAAVLLGEPNIHSIERLRLLSGADTEFFHLAPEGTRYQYNLKLLDSLAGAPDKYEANPNFLVDASTLRSGEGAIVDASAETTVRYVLNGGAGDDRFLGGGGGDELHGGGGNDHLRGGGGADQLFGGSGSDTFEYAATTDSTAAARDSIADFARLDRIDLSAIDADGNAGNGNQDFRFVGAAAFGGSAGEVRVIADVNSAGGWLVEGDFDGDRIADVSIQVVAESSFAWVASDFVL